MLTAADANGHAGQYFRVEGTRDVRPRVRGAEGTGLGGNDFAGGGLLIELASGGEENEYYGFDAADFPEPSEDCRVLVLLSTP